MNLYNLNKDKLKIEPFPYLIVENFLDKVFFEKLNVSFPDEIFEEFDKEKKRTNINFNHPLLKKFMNDKKDWKNFKNLLIDKKFVGTVIDIFKPTFKNFDLNINLKNYHAYLSHNYEKANMTNYELLKHSFITRYLKIKNLILKIFNIPSLRIDIQLSRSKSGYNLAPHTDQRSKIIIVLFYLNDMLDDKGNDISNLNLFKNKSGNSKDWVRHPDLADVEKFDSIKVRKNKFLMMLNSKNSYHGVEEFNSGNFRKFVYLSISVANIENIWS
jgi:hypothetical protein